MPAVQLPRDARSHNAHYEWWYAHGYLTNEAQQQFSFMFSFFKFDKETVSEYFPQLSIYPGKTLHQLHIGLTDITDQTHHFDQMTFIPLLGRVGMGKSKASAFFGPNRLVQFDENRYDLQMRHHGKSIHLHLFDQKGPVLHGKQGVISFPKLGSTSYYSHPRLAVEGKIDTLEDSDENLPTQFVHGSAWIDHQWGSFLTHQPMFYWTWIAIQFEDNSEIMIYDLFDKDGTSKGIKATWFDKNKKRKILKATIKPTHNWQSPKTKTRYPVDYEVKVPELKLNVQVSASMFDQEMSSPWYPYWEGACTAIGEIAGQPIKGLAFLEQTGFNKLTERGLKKRLAPLEQSID